MKNSETGTWIFVSIITLVLLTSDGLVVNLTVLETAVASGAVCLDGTPPAYHFAPGFGSGVNNWLVHFEGGGWCHDVSNCLYRRRGRLGSSKAMGSIIFSGILNDHQRFNPEFFNWNKVRVGYCDGSSFTGDVESVDPITNLHYRGARIFVAVMEDLLEKGMRNAENALLSGCSAGGLASILHCDNFRAFLPATARVKCLSDSGFFINIKDIAGGEHLKTYFKQIVTTHGSVKNLPSSCTSNLNLDPGMCFFPQYVLEDIQTPLFILNPAYDSWQVRNALLPTDADPGGDWADCRMDISRCSIEQIQTLQFFRAELLKALGTFGSDPSTGMFINSCFAHCQSELTEMWEYADSPVLDNLTVSRAVGDWFYDRSDVKKIDCPYPCDSSCHNINYGSQPHGNPRDYPQYDPQQSSPQEGPSPRWHPLLLSLIILPSTVILALQS